MENENLKPVQELTPFTKMIMTIGVLPTSFYSSMSYYESMVWLYEYLKNQVIPTVNNNAEAVEELQTAFITLKTWIEEYFDNLDVQEEINNKLDAMALDGTLTNLIKAYVDPIYQAYETEINGAIRDQNTTISTAIENQNLSISNKFSQQDEEIQAIDNKVIAARSGAPLVASSTAGMTDTTKIYVNTTDGYWYYYDGDSWEQGGVYQASEDSSTVTNLTTNAFQNRGTIASGTLADRYEIGFFYVTSDHFPSDLPEANESGILLNYWTSNYYRRHQIFITYHNTTYIRNYRGTGYSSWTKLDSDSCFQNRGDIISGTCADVTKQGTYFIGQDYIPSDWISSNDVGLLISYYTSNNYRNYQLAINYNTYEMFERHKKGSSWSSWAKLNQRNRITYSPTGYFTIDMGNSEYMVKRYTNQGSNVDIWRITDTMYRETIITEYTTDIEGPVKEKDTADFIGGVHGDEQLTDIKVIVDGNVVDLENDTLNTYFNCVTFYIKSNVYHCNTNNLAFTRNKILTFKDGKCYVSNYWVVQDNPITIVRATGGGLISVYDSDLNGVELNSTMEYIPINSVGNGIQYENKDLTKITFKTDFGNVILENLIGKEQPNYLGFVQHFTNELVPRLKGYFNVIDSTAGITLQVNDTIRTEFSIEIK